MTRLGIAATRSPLWERHELPFLLSFDSSPKVALTLRSCFASCFGLFCFVFWFILPCAEHRVSVFVFVLYFCTLFPNFQLLFHEMHIKWKRGNMLVKDASFLLILSNVDN